MGSGGGTSAANGTRGGQAAVVRTARVLMILAALAAGSAAVAAIARLGEATPDTVIVQTWRAYGLVVFAGLFALLAWRPLGYRGVWELVIGHKVALSLSAVILVADAGRGGGAADAASVLVWDGSLSVVLLAAYLSCRGWRSWHGSRGRRLRLGDDSNAQTNRSPAG